MEQETLGIFGAVGSGGKINSVSVVDANITGFIQVGGLVGRNDRGVISNSSVSGSVDGIFDVGGLVGQNLVGTVSSSYSTASIEGQGSVGGLVGENTFGTVKESYATGSVDGSNEVGGLAGANYGTISESYASGSVDRGDPAGGLVGQNGQDAIPPDDGSEGTLIDSYWDTERTGQSEAIGQEGGEDDGEAKGGDSIVSGQVEGLTMSEMTGSEAASNMDSFDFATTWKTVPSEYPMLSWESDSGADGSPVEGVSDELWTAVTQDDGSDGLSLADLGNAIQQYQANPSDADVDGAVINLSDLGSLIQYYRTEAA